MKFSTIVLALATVVAAAPSATAEYVCHTEAIFTYASEATPSISTKAQEFLGSVMVDTFNEAYTTEVIKDDAPTTPNLRSARNLRHGSSNGGRCGPTCDNDDDSRMLEVVPDVRMLWRGSTREDKRYDYDDDSRMLSSEVDPAGERKLWKGWSTRNLRHGSSNGGRCGPTCDNDDDSRMLSSETSGGDRKLWTNASHGSGGFSVEFGSLKEHVAWEKLVLENGRTHTELSGLKDCKIVLSDCHIE